MRFSIISFVFALLSLFAVVAHAAPVGYLEQRDVFVPPIIAPAEGAVWKRGTVQTVVWDVSKPPAQITNTKGHIYVRSVAQKAILLDKPLAENFEIMDGKRAVTVPKDLPTGDYQIVVMGNSGNWGRVFKIVA